MWVEKNFLLLKIIARRKKKKTTEALHKSIWVRTTYLWPSGTRREQHFNKWKSFFYQVICTWPAEPHTHRGTWVPSCPVCYICPWPIFKSCHKVSGGGDKNYITNCTVLSKTNYVWIVIRVVHKWSIETGLKVNLHHTWLDLFNHTTS